MRLPKIHLLLCNRLTQYDSTTAQSFDQLCTKAEEDMHQMFVQHPHAFTYNQAAAGHPVGIEAAVGTALPSAFPASTFPAAAFEVPSVPAGPADTVPNHAMANHAVPTHAVPTHHEDQTHE